MYDQVDKFIAHSIDDDRARFSTKTQSRANVNSNLVKSADILHFANICLLEILYFEFFGEVVSLMAHN